MPIDYKEYYYKYKALKYYVKNEMKGGNHHPDMEDVENIEGGGEVTKVDIKNYEARAEYKGEDNNGNAIKTTYEVKKTEEDKEATVREV